MNICRNKEKHLDASGFTLLGLSVVLVIIGLLIGGILVGKDLLRTSELQAAIKEYQNYKSAINAFEVKYRAFPGDMYNATDFWGSMTNCGADSPSGTGTQTCNGNGDGKLQAATAAGRTGEMHMIWRHLSIAGLIPGTYTGISGPGNGISAVPGENQPLSKLKSAAWTAYSTTISTTCYDSVTFCTEYGNYVILGADQANNHVSGGPVLRPRESFYIDTKIDDGRPGRGIVIEREHDICTDSANKDDLDADYDLNVTSVSCVLIFKNIF